MTTPIAALKTWFERLDKPTQFQYWAWLDSFFHKDDKIPIDSIQYLQDTLNSKQDKQVLEPNVTIWLPTEAYFAANDVYRSYVNLASPDEVFHKEAIYRCKVDTFPGESPETHPEKWASQGGSVGTIRIDSVVDLRAELDAKLEAADLQKASNTTIGITKLSVAPVDPFNPIAVADNDPRINRAAYAYVPAGAWSPTTNTPTLTDADTSKAGFVYICSDSAVRFTDSDGYPILWRKNDRLVYDQTGQIWFWDSTDVTRAQLGLASTDTVTFANLTGTNTGDQDLSGLLAKSLATAADQVLVSSGVGTWIAKSLADFKIWLGLKSAAFADLITSWGTPTDTQIASARLVSDTFSAVQLGQAVTVGTGGQYVNIGSALAAGKNTIVVISNITEIAHLAVTTVNPTTVYIYGFNKYTVSMGNYSFQGVNGTFLFTRNLQFTCSAGFFTSSYFEGLRMDDCTVINSAGIMIQGNGFSSFTQFINCSITLANSPSVASSLQGNVNNLGNLTVINTRFTGVAGSNCTLAIGSSASYSTYVNGLTILGTFNNVWLNGEITNVKGSATITTLKFMTDSLTGDNHITNISLPNANLTTASTTANLDRLVSINNGYFNTIIGTTSYARLFINNTTFVNNCSFAQTNGVILDKIQFGLSTGNITLTITGNQVELKSSVLFGSGSISGSKNIISNCFVGVSGGTTKTLTLSSGASYNTIENCTFEVAPVIINDNYTNTFRNNRLWDGTLLPDKIPLPPIFVSNAAAISGGLAVGTRYRTGGDPDVLAIVH